MSQQQHAEILDEKVLDGYYCCLSRYGEEFNPNRVFCIQIFDEDKQQVLNTIAFGHNSLKATLYFNNMK